MTSFIVAVNLLVIFAWSWMIWKNSDVLLRKFFWPAWAFKLLSGIGVGLLYTYYYPASDTITYHEDGKIIASFARNDFFGYLRFLFLGDESFDLGQQISSIQPRALFAVKLISITNLLTSDNYWIASMYFSLISLWGVWKLSEEVVIELPGLHCQVAVSFLFLPSFVFWSSGLIKESVAVAALFFLAALVFKAWSFRRLAIWEWIVLPIALILLWKLKYYYLAVFAPIAFALLSARILFKRYSALPLITRSMIWLITLIAPLVIMTMIHPNLHPKAFLGVIVANYEDFLDTSLPAGTIHYEGLEPTLLSVLRHSPKALLSGLFRPLLWEARTLVQVIDAIENTVILILSVTALLKIRRVIASPDRLLTISILLYCVTLCVFLAMSTPNFGSLTRYRVGFMPFYFLLITINNPILDRLNRLVQRN